MVLYMQINVHVICVCVHAYMHIIDIHNRWSAWLASHTLQQCGVSLCVFAGPGELFWQEDVSLALAILKDVVVVRC